MVIFFYGEDSFRSSEKLKAIKNKFLGSAAHADLSVFDFEESPGTEIDESIFSAGLFSSKKLIIFRNLLSKGRKEAQDEVKKILEKRKKLGEDKEITLIFWENASPRKNGSFFKFILNFPGVKKQEFKKLEGTALEKWIEQRLIEINPKSAITQEALAKLVAYSGENMFFLAQEIEKLINFSGEKKIEEAAVEKLVRASLGGNIFATIEALGGNNKKEALKLLLEHLEKGDDPFYLLSMFCFQFRNMLLVADAKRKNITNDFEIAKETGLHPFVVKKSLLAIQGFSWEKLKSIYSSLVDLDRKAKTGKTDIKLSLQKFVVDL